MSVNHSIVLTIMHLNFSWLILVSNFSFWKPNIFKIMLFPCLISLMEIFFPFNFFLLSQFLFLYLYLPSLVTIDLGFSPAFLFFPIQCALSLSQSLIAKSKCSFITLMHNLSVFSYTLHSMFYTHISYWNTFQYKYII